TVRQIYAKRLIEGGVITPQEHQAMTEAVLAKLEKALEYAQNFKPSDSPPAIHGPWANFTKLPRGNEWSAKTGVEKETLKSIAKAATTAPADFNLHKTVARTAEERMKAVTDEKGIDWGCGEMLALGSLLNEGTWIRLTGQDVSRGTFSHRNAVWFDNK